MTGEGRVRGAVIAGGTASRFGGRPKGLERVGGVRLLDLVAGVLEEALGAPPLLVANAPEAGTWRSDLQVVSDIRPGAGAVCGIYTAVVEAPAPVVCVAWDMPFVPAALVRMLAEGLAAADLCLPASGGPRGMEPLCAAYGPACEPAIRAALDRGDARAIGFHDRLSVSILSREALGPLGPPDEIFFNVNTADDLAEAERRWAKHASSR